MLNKELTIVIPCKNEGINIYECIGLLHKQKLIEGVRVIIADCSDDKESLNWLCRCIADFSDKLVIKIIDGGFPAKARLEGSKLVTTPYILFLDADIMLKDELILGEVLSYNKDLVTVECEPITVLSAISTPLIITVFQPTITLFPILISLKTLG